jgi:hypothetical protein
MDNLAGRDAEIMCHREGVTTQKIIDAQDGTGPPASPANQRRLGQVADETVPIDGNVVGFVFEQASDIRMDLGLDQASRAGVHAVTKHSASYS